MTDASRTELGDFLRSRREKLTPQAVSLPGGRRRRTPGLRREEVAELAGIGVDWYIRLEQGRSVTPSATTVNALAHALQLNETEHVHLRVLAREPVQQTFVREQPTAAIVRLINGLNQPAYVTGRRWDLLIWNTAAQALFGFEGEDDAQHNVLAYMFLDPRARELFGADWAAEGRRMVAQFRSTFDVWARDRAFLGLIGRLREGSPEFAAWWDDHDIRPVVSGRKSLRHPSGERCCYEYATFQANDDPALKLVIYTLVDHESAGAHHGTVVAETKSC
ncbi:helix-turn-helix transcriptional regulator [Deinococcus altitudinis]|uniref:helix-turn-helix transcriptional regulator n=1 Tax=Deinococcus altitudinis TaxID=468914 RepID=UPI00389155F6